MEYIWKILAIIAIISALVNAAMYGLIFKRVKLVFDCRTLLTEYAMSAVVVLILLGQVLGDVAIFFLLAGLVAAWVAIVKYFEKRSFNFFRLFGVSVAMHARISQMLVKSCAENGLERTQAYIFGGDTQTPCNTLIFRKADKQAIAKISKKMNLFLKKYGVRLAPSCILAWVIDAFVIYIALTVF